MEVGIDGVIRVVPRVLLREGDAVGGGAVAGGVEAVAGALGLEGGAAVAVYPEGTTTRNADFTPMAAKNGVARLAALTGAPVAVTGAVLAAAVLHAGWNALLKGTGDRLATVVLLDLTGVALATPWS